MSSKNELRRLAGELITVYLKHQSFKAHEGSFMPLSLEGEEPGANAVAHDARRLRRSLKELAGVRLSASEARDVWPRVLEHKWYLGERLGRDVGMRVAAVDYFENVWRPLRRTWLRAKGGGLPPRLPMMMPLGHTS
ncbi:MAG TPA: DUF4032 domain-containing protein [Pyrinomonadaceae bacterium]|jgi:hypothetical protein